MFLEPEKANICQVGERENVCDNFFATSLFTKFSLYPSNLSPLSQLQFANFTLAHPWVQRHNFFCLLQTQKQSDQFFQS